MKKNTGPGRRPPGAVKSRTAAVGQEKSAGALKQVRGQMEPAFAFAMSYLQLLSEELGLGALAVWFGSEGIEHYAVGRPREFEWQNELAALLRTTAPLGPPGQSTFCATLRRNREADRRCHECDAKWIARARKSGRSWAYQCHAGLSEVIAPIVVNGQRVGEVMGGQIASAERLPDGFRDVWRRVSDIEGLDRTALEKAFARVQFVDQAALRDIQTRLRAAARALGALVEGVAALISRQSLLGQVRSYAERDFAWYALTQPDAPEDAIHASAAALGFSEPPSVVMVILPDRASRKTLAGGRAHIAPVPTVLFEGAQRLLQNQSNAFVSSIRPGELVVLLSPHKTRNPTLRRLQVEELAARIKKELQPKCREALLVGVSNCEAPFSSLAKA